MTRLAGLLLVATLIPACGPTSGSGDSDGAIPVRPNVVLIVADDLGYADLGVHGSSQALTPHIDSIAAGGVRCTNGYVSGPYCSPTRAGLLTGRYQQRFGHEFNVPPGSAYGLPLTEVTIADRMKAAGYATGLVGKWHLGAPAAYHPTQRGFDEFYGFLGGSRAYYGGTVLRGTVNEPLTGYLTDRFGAEAVDFIDRRKSSPFFLMLTFNAVHIPMDIPPAMYMDRFPGVTDPTRKAYLAMLAAMDDAIGGVIARLKTLNLERDTLVIFLSDNGGPHTSSVGLNGSVNTPLRGGKATLWEGGIRVPFMARWPARLPAGRVYHEPVIQLDLFTTAVKAAGGTVPSDRVIDGVDLIPFLDGTSAAAPHENLYWRFGDPEPAAIRKGAWKLKTAAGMAPELYNLPADIGEATNVAAANPAVVADLQADLSAWKSQLIPPLW